MYARAHTYFGGVYGYGYTYPEDIKNAAMSWNQKNLPDSLSQAHSAYDAFIMSCNCPPERHNPKAWANYGCKDSELFWIEQE